jgi:5'-nucleotidase
MRGAVSSSGRKIVRSVAFGLCFAVAAPPIAARAVTPPTDEVRERAETAAPVAWRSPQRADPTTAVRLVAINDLHGYLETTARLRGAETTRPAGGAAVLASYVAEERRERGRERTLVLVAGDSIGASAPVSAFLREEPTMAFLNALADGPCPRLSSRWPREASPVRTRCRTLATLGNHEFDRGVAELERLLYGGGGWRGMSLPFVAANVVRRADRRPLLPGSAIVDLAGVKVGVVGAVTVETAMLLAPERIADVEFLPEAPAVNAEVGKLRAAGADAVVLLIHEGLQAPLRPVTEPLALDAVSGRLKDVLAAVAPGVDVVVSAHSHKFTNVLVAASDGPPLLVTQARYQGTSYASIDLEIDRASRRVVAKTARILTPWADEGPGLAPDAKVAAQVAAATRAAATVGARRVGESAAPLTRARVEGSLDSALGRAISDLLRRAAGTDVAFISGSSVRADWDAGPITYGELYSSMPYDNRLMRYTLTGDQIRRALEQQWRGDAPEPRDVLNPSGLRYTYDVARPPGQRVAALRDADGRELDPARRYTVASNDYLLGGASGFDVFRDVSDAVPLGGERAIVEDALGRAGAVRPNPDRRSTATAR